MQEHCLIMVLGLQILSNKRTKTGCQGRQNGINFVYSIIELLSMNEDSLVFMNLEKMRKLYRIN